MMLTAEILVELGGKVWEKGTMRRIYFNYDELAKFYGLEYTGFGYRVDGEKVSNNSGRIFEGALRRGKFWYDITTGEFASKDMSEAMTAKLVERITKAAEEFVAEDAEVETATEEVAAPVVPVQFHHRSRALSIANMERTQRVALGPAAWVK